jgi:hypothetical protein
MEINEMFIPNIYARKQLEIGNESYRLHQIQEAEVSWNNAMKSACNVTCYDAGEDHVLPLSPCLWFVYLSLFLLSLCLSFSISLSHPLVGVIFLASYKLAVLFSSQPLRVIERNVAIHQALTAYHRIFDGEDDPTALPFQSLIQHLHQLRSDLTAPAPSSAVDEPNQTQASPSPTHSVLPPPQQQQQQQHRYIYQKAEIQFLSQVRETIEIPSSLLSYQNIVRTESSKSSSSSSSSSLSSSKKKNSKTRNDSKKKSAVEVESSSGSGRREWGSSTGPSLDHILSAAVGNDYFIVTEIEGREGETQREGERGSGARELEEESLNRAFVSDSNDVL